MDGSGSNGNNENWKQFRGTELGSMLSGIYGNQRPQINYPQPKKKAFDPAKQKFLPVNAKVNSGQWQDPRKTTRRETSGKVSVPTGFKGAGYQRENYAPIDFIVARKGYSEIKKEIDVTKERSRAYRPPVNNFKIGEDEKERYSQVCAYKGGKGMIEAGTHISRDQTPYEVTQQRKRIDQESAFRASRKLGLSARSTNRAAAVAPEAPKQLSDKEQMADQIAAEINERADYLEEMEAMGGLSKAEKKRLQGEIRTRTVELESMQL